MYSLGLFSSSACIIRAHVIRSSDVPQDGYHHVTVSQDGPNVQMRGVKTRRTTGLLLSSGLIHSQISILERLGVNGKFAFPGVLLFRDLERGDRSFPPFSGCVFRSLRFGTDASKRHKKALEPPSPLPSPFPHSLDKCTGSLRDISSELASSPAPGDRGSSVRSAQEL